MSQKRSRREYEADLRRQKAPFVIYGTPLPPLDENTRDDGSYVPIWKQEVTDERGRKRLHGAFTGGFSAGYFNSVGSKEGWAPSSFVSSRSNRARDAIPAQQRRVEDFMDDEDLREQEESRQISAADGFAGFGAQSSDVVTHALDDLFKPSQESVGEKLLNKMGWKKGQGIGPRIRRKVEIGSTASEEKDFPPQDSPILEFRQKHDCKGLSFAASQNHSTADTTMASQLRADDNMSDENPSVGVRYSRPSDKAKKLPKTPGIGVGALNDTGSDDDDPYELGPKVSYNRVLGGEKKSKKPKSSAHNANPALKLKPTFVSKKLPTALKILRKCHDGKLPLAGFTLVDLDELNSFGAMSLSKEEYEPPQVPEDWQPKQIVDRSDHLSPDLVTPTTQPPSTAQNQTAQSRASILKETPLPSKSVFDYLSPAARDRLAIASGRKDLPPALGEAAPLLASDKLSAQSAQFQSLEYPHLDPATALTALTRLRKDKDKPYADDLPKQGRYKDFLRFSADPKPVAERVPPLRSPTHNLEDDHLAEITEFATTANLFRPASGFFASRFTSAASSAASDTSRTPTYDEKGNETKPVDDFLRKPEDKPKDPAEEAARMGMFGVATRSTIGFFPSKLLCKRFGVDMPNGNE